jgi:hypothetical protein
MDPIALIVTALAAGAAMGAKSTASSAVTDAYSALKSLARSRLHGRPGGDLVLNRHEQGPDTWRAPLMEELEAVRADRDPALVGAAQALMNMIRDSGGKAGKYTVDARGAYGVQIGDQNKQHLVVNASPDDLGHYPEPAPASWTRDER